MTNNVYEKAIECIIAGFKPILNQLNLTGITIGQSALDYRKERFPLLLIEWNMASSPQLPNTWLSQDGCILMASRLLEFESRLLCYSNEHPAECLYILEALALGQSTEIFKQAMAAEMKTQGITRLATVSIDGIEQEDTVDQDNQIFYAASAKLKWNMNEGISLGKFPILGLNRQDRVITFEKQGPIFRASFSPVTIDFQTTNNFKTVYNKPPASEPVNMFINDNRYKVTKISNTEFETEAVSTEDRITETKLKQIINYQLKNTQWLFSFDTTPEMDLTVQGGKRPITRQVIRKG